MKYEMKQDLIPLRIILLSTSLHRAANCSGGLIYEKRKRIQLILVLEEVDFNGSGFQIKPFYHILCHAKMSLKGCKCTGANNPQNAASKQAKTQ